MSATVQAALVSTPAKTAAMTIGGLAGAAAGHAAASLVHGEAYEIVVRLRNGNTIVVVQEGPPPTIGTSVWVTQGARSRVIPK